MIYRWDMREFVGNVYFDLGGYYIGVIRIKIF